MEKSTKKIAFVHTYFPAGGSERVTLDIAKHLLALEDYEIFVFTGNYYPEKMPDAIDTSRFHIIALPEPRIEKSAADQEMIVREIEKCGIDVLVAVGRHLNVLGRIHALGCSTIYAHHGMPFWEITNKRMNAIARKSESWLKWLEYHTVFFIKDNVLHTYDRKFTKLYTNAITEYDAFTVLCEPYRTEIASRLGIDAGKIHAIPNMEEPVGDVNFNKQNTFLYVGRLSYGDKRLDRLIDAWSLIHHKLPQWNLVIVGDGEEGDNLRHRAANLPRVTFAGYQIDVSAFYRDASAVCLVSEHEGWPLCLTEARSNGVIPIAMECSAGVRTIVEPSGVNGFLCPKGDVEAFARQMLDFAMMDAGAVMKMRHNVVKKSLEYSPERIGELWRQLFDKLIAARKS